MAPVQQAIVREASENHASGTVRLMLEMQRGEVGSHQLPFFEIFVSFATYEDHQPILGRTMYNDNGMWVFDSNETMRDTLAGDLRLAYSGLTLEEAQHMASYLLQYGWVRR